MYQDRAITSQRFNEILRSLLKQSDLNPSHFHLTLCDQVQPLLQPIVGNIWVHAFCLCIIIEDKNEAAMSKLFKYYCKVHNPKGLPRPKSLRKQRK